MMDFFDSAFHFVGDCLSGALNVAESVVDFVAENPGKVVLTVVATAATGGLAAAGRQRGPARRR